MKLNGTAGYNVSVSSRGGEGDVPTKSGRWGELPRLFLFSVSGVVDPIVCFGFAYAAIRSRRWGELTFWVKSGRKANICQEQSRDAEVDKLARKIDDCKMGKSEDVAVTEVQQSHQN